MTKSVKNGLIAGGLALALASGVFIGQAWAYQRHMERALDDLQSAKGELQVALRNKGGHRVEALRLVDRAIEETREGIEAGE